MIDFRTKLPKKLDAAVAELLEASSYARDTQSELWDFAVSIHRLHELGASETTLRWLVKKGFVEHAREVTIAGDDGRSYRPTGDLTFAQETCFVLTATGMRFANSWWEPTGIDCEAVGDSTGRQTYLEYSFIPHWDENSRKLCFGGRLVKWFKRPAANQQAVLCALQEEGWPERIDDPLPPQPAQNPKRRLADTIKCLNKKQVNSLIVFHGDGTGEGVIWEATSTSESS